MTSSTTQYDNSIAIMIIILNSVSLVALCFIVVIYIINWKSIASFSMRLSFYLCLSCVGQNLTVIILNPITLHQLEASVGKQTSSLCVFQGILKVSFDLSSIIWTTLIIYSVYASIVKNLKLENKQIIYLLIGFILPLSVACIPIIFKSYVFDNYYCWFSSAFSQLGFWLRFGYFFLPLWILFIVNITLSCLTYQKLRQIQIPDETLKIFKRLLLFPLILFLTGAFATADAIYQFSTQNYLAWLNNTGLFFLNIYGILNAIAYGLNPVIKDILKLSLTKNQHVSFASDGLSYQRQRTSSLNSQRIRQQLMQMTNIKRVPLIDINNTTTMPTKQQYIQ